MLHSGGVNVFIVYNVSMILITIVTVPYSISLWVLVKAFDPKQTGFFLGASNGRNFPDDEKPLLAVKERMSVAPSFSMVVVV